MDWACRCIRNGRWICICESDNIIWCDRWNGGCWDGNTDHDFSLFFWNDRDSFTKNDNNGKLQEEQADSICAAYTNRVSSGHSMPVYLEVERKHNNKSRKGQQSFGWPFTLYWFNKYKTGRFLYY